MLVEDADARGPLRERELRRVEKVGIKAVRLVAEEGRDLILAAGDELGGVGTEFGERGLHRYLGTVLHINFHLMIIIEVGAGL